MIATGWRAGLALCGLSLLTGCVTEKITRPNHAAPSKRAAGSPTPMTPVTTRVDPSRSVSASAKVALQPLGYVPYDGYTLPVVLPGGLHLATQLGESARFIHPGKAAQPGTTIEIYDLSRAPFAALRPDTADSIILSPEPDPGGFLIWTIGADGVWAPAKCLVDGRVEHGEHPQPDMRLYNLRSQVSNPSTQHQIYWSASLGAAHPADGIPCLLYWHPGPGSSDPRMMLLAAPQSVPTRLAPNSIAGCWASTKAGPAVLVTMTDGLYLQRLTRDANGWRAEEPNRLLRESYVPRATNNPERPFILIGPGPKDKPEMLQIMAMKLIEE